MNKTSSSRSGKAGPARATSRAKRHSAESDLFRRAVTMAPVPMAAYDSEGRPLFVNEKMAALFGYESVTAFLEAIPNGAMLFTEEQRRQLQEHIGAMGEAAGDREFIFAMRRRDGGEFFAAAEFSPFKDDGGTLTHLYQKK